MRGFSILLMVLALTCQFGCGKDTSSRSGSGANNLFTAVKNTTPTFTATTSHSPLMVQQGLTSRSLTSAMTITDPALLVAFQLLRDYTYPDDEGKVDMTNIYKVLWEAGRYLDEAKSICTEITATADSSISPYTFSDFLGNTYDCGGTQPESGGYGSSVAYKEDGAEKSMLTSYKWAPDSAEQISIGVIQTTFNDTTKDVQLLLAQAVNYPPNSSMGGVSGSGFALRTSIKGNSGAHSFDLKITMNSISTISTTMCSTTLVGKGISQGLGNYFLIRSGSNYYCIPAGATETDLGGIVPTNQDGVSADCAAYVADVSAATPYDSNTEVPNIDLSDFNHGVSGTPVNYLMF